jgi:SAM-dependent methyltransferase
MLSKARERLGGSPNLSFAVEDGQSLSFPDRGFDSVICNMGLMYFPDPARGLSEFHRVLRPGGRAAVSVFTRADRALVGGLIRAAIARHVPSKAAEAERFFAVGDEARLRSAFEGAGFVDVEITTEALTFAFPSFDPYFGGAERGTASWGRSTWRCSRIGDVPCGRRSAGRPTMLADRSMSEWRSGSPAGSGSGRLRLARGMRRRTRTSRRADCLGRLGEDTR